MKPVFQTRFGDLTGPVEEMGNCFTACVASLLELPLEEVDEYLEGLETPGAVETRWWGNFVSWCSSRGLVPLYFSWGDRATPEQYAYGKPKMRYLALGISPRGIGHAVVWEDGKMIHDPYPDGGGLVSVDAYVILVNKL